MNGRTQELPLSDFRSTGWRRPEETVDEAAVLLCQAYATALYK